MLGITALGSHWLYDELYVIIVTYSETTFVKLMFSIGSSIQKTAAFAFVGLLFLARPGVFGEHTGPVYVVGAFCIILAVRFMGVEAKRWQQRDLWVVGVFLLYWAYRFFQVLNWDVLIESKVILKSFIFELITVVILLFVLNSEKQRALVFDGLSLVVAVLGLSSFISLVASWAGLSQAITVGMLSRTEAADSSQFILQLPMSVMYGEWNGLSQRMVYRYTGGFIEPGIYPAFACWAISYRFFVSQRFWLVAVGCILGMYACFSTAAILCLAVSIPIGFVAYILKRSHMSRTLQLTVISATIILIPAGGFAVLYSPDIGVVDKMETHGVSLEDRGVNIRDGLQSLPANPLGFHDKQTHRSICLLAAAFGLGWVGLSLWGLKAIVALAFSGNDVWIVASSLAALVVTLLVAQPIFDAMPAVIALLLCQYRQRIVLEADAFTDVTDSV